jgi:hypothetical protein
MLIIPPEMRVRSITWDNERSIKKMECMKNSEKYNCHPEGAFCPKDLLLKNALLSRRSFGQKAPSG